MKYLKTKLKCLFGFHAYIEKSRTVQTANGFKTEIYKQCMHCLKEKMLR